MTLPANIRLNVKASFPTQVQGSGYVVITKNNGIWTIANDYTILAPLAPGFDATAWSVAVENLSTKQFSTTTLASLIVSVNLTTSSYREITAAGDVAVVPTDVGFLMNKLVGAATNINLPLAGTRAGVPVWVKDYKGDANVNNIRFVLAGADTVDGFNQAAADANGTSKLVINYGTKTFWPRTAGGWYVR
jgi:hypothetical protein